MIETKQEESLPSLRSFSEHTEIIVGPETQIRNSHCASSGSAPALRTLAESSEGWNANLPPPGIRVCVARVLTRSNGSDENKAPQTRAAAMELAGARQHGQDSLQAREAALLYLK